MKSNTMSRILLSVFILIFVVFASYYAGEGMKALAWLWMILTIVLLALVWVPWKKLRKSE
jgi:hypothetical protein